MNKVERNYILTDYLNYQLNDFMATHKPCTITTPPYPDYVFFIFYNYSFLIFHIFLY